MEFAIVGAGLVGTATAYPLSDNRHSVRLVGTHLDGEVIKRCKEDHYHSKLKRKLPESIRPNFVEEMGEALEGVEVIVSGVNSLRQRIDESAIQQCISASAVQRINDRSARWPSRPEAWSDGNPLSADFPMISRRNHPVPLKNGRPSLSLLPRLPARQEAGRRASSSTDCPYLDTPPIQQYDRRMFNRRLFTVLAIVFVQLAGAALILPILPLFAERQFNLSPTSVSLLVSSFFIAQFFAGPLLGQLSDRYGRIPLLIISQLGSAASFFLMAVAGSAWLLFAARAVDGITGGNIIIAQAYVTDITPPEKRTEAFGYIYAAFGIGFIVGPALGGLLSAWFGARFPFVVAGVAALVTAGMCLLLEETVQTGKAAAVPRGSPVDAPRPALYTRPPTIRLSPVQVMRNTPLLMIMAVGFIGQFGLGMVQATFALYAAAVLFRGAGIDATNLGVGLLLAVVGLGQFVTQTWLIRPMKARFGDARLVILGTLLRAVALVIWAVVTSPWLAAAGSLFFAVGMGLTMPPLQTLATRTVDESLRGGVLGVFQSAVSLAIIISTAIAGVIFSAGVTLPYWTGAVLCLAAILPAFSVLRRANEEALAPCSEPCLEPSPAD